MSIIVISPIHTAEGEISMDPVVVTDYQELVNVG